MSKSRKGLKRAGMRSYSVESPAGLIIIERERRSMWLIRLPGTMPPFHNGQHRSLTAARAEAEGRPVPTPQLAPRKRRATKNLTI